jgi:hypothetical protein
VKEYTVEIESITVATVQANSEEEAEALATSGDYKEEVISQSASVIVEE